MGRRKEARAHAFRGQASIRRVLNPAVWPCGDGCKSGAGPTAKVSPCPRGLGSRLLSRVGLNPALPEPGRMAMR
jgi:hypothetical protein